MTNVVISKFCDNEKLNAESCVRIDMKKRNAIFGYLIKGSDYEYLMAKNFWRIVVHSNIAAWKKTNNPEIAKIYNGAEFLKLSVVALP